MMKLAWICYDHDLDDIGDKMPTPVILFKEPARYQYHTIIPIVYAKLDLDND